ncbi:sperm-associated antigen 8-like [Saccoglossus kowalevskii]|uniref:Sperm-associated antigen 8-like n=1 Tax=Saccoglossus kowalevskii TaxID=10224 RepID=A0ABM0GX95_SACKO|nr:PREDICTED: sperm-associated antigen 8-like [Saccoglossus kowalevskii]
MTTLNPSRTINNSDGKCLLENWVEERSTRDLGLDDKSKDSTNIKQLGVRGHSGILTTNNEAKQEKISTCMDSYRPPESPGVRLVGKKQQMLEKMLYEKVSQEVHEEFNPPPPEPEYVSVTKKDFTVEGFVSESPEPTMDHNVETEQPITFWSDHKMKITGVSQIKTHDTPFRKNDAFSKPIEERFDEAHPYELEQYPWM